MRLLHVSHQYWPAVGGAERYITDLSEVMASRRHAVSVYTSRSVDYRSWRNELPPHTVRSGVEVRRFFSVPRKALVWRLLSFGTYHYLRTRLPCFEPLIFLGNGPVCPALAGAILRSARQFDLVHINNLHYSHAPVAYAAARLAGLPVVITPHIHCNQPETHDVGYMRRILGGCDAVLAVTRAENDYLRDRGLGEIVTGGNGLRLEQFPPLDPVASRIRLGIPVSAFVVLFLGRKEEYKGLGLCLEAFRVLRKARPDIVLLAVGPETEFSKQLWSEHGDLEGLVVRGTVSNDERLAALAACDVLALPSTGEAFGIVYLEAWAYRKPVVGARIPSVCSVVEDGQDGFLVQPQLAPVIDALSRLHGNLQLGQAMGQRGREKLERRYTVGRIADIFEGTCARVLRHHNMNHH